MDQLNASKVQDHAKIPVPMFWLNFAGCYGRSGSGCISVSNPSLCWPQIFVKMFFFGPISIALRTVGEALKELYNFKAIKPEPSQSQ